MQDKDTSIGSHLKIQVPIQMSMSWTWNLNTFLVDVLCPAALIFATATALVFHILGQDLLCFQGFDPRTLRLENLALTYKEINRLAGLHLALCDHTKYHVTASPNPSGQDSCQWDWQIIFPKVAGIPKVSQSMVLSVGDSEVKASRHYQKLGAPNISHWHVRCQVKRCHRRFWEHSWALPWPWSCQTARWALAFRDPQTRRSLKWTLRRASARRMASLLTTRVTACSVCSWTRCPLSCQIQSLVQLAQSSLPRMSLCLHGGLAMKQSWSFITLAWWKSVIRWTSSARHWIMSGPCSRRLATTRSCSSASLTVKIFWPLRPLPGRWSTQMRAHQQILLQLMMATQGHWSPGVFWTSYAITPVWTLLNMGWLPIQASHSYSLLTTAMTPSEHNCCTVDRHEPQEVHYFLGRCCVGGLRAASLGLWRQQHWSESCCLVISASHLGFCCISWCKVQ